MGLFKKFTDNMGYLHISMLTRDCSILISNTLERIKSYDDNTINLDEEAKKKRIEKALDILIDEGHYNIIKEKNIQDIKIKFTMFHDYYVNRHLGRQFDYATDDNKILYETIQRMWLVFMNKHIY